MTKKKLWGLALVLALAISSVGCTKTEEQPKEDGPTFSGRIVYGIVGIERFFGVCHKTASDWKKDWLKPAIKQEGRKIMMDVEYALKLYGEKHPKETK